MSVSYTLKESFAGFRRNRSASLITVFTVSISLLLLGVFAIITMNFANFVDQIRSRVDVEIFLSSDINQRQQEEMADILSHIPGVDEAIFIGKEEAAEIFARDFGESFDDILENNPLPQSFRLSIREGYNNADSVQLIADKVERMQLVESVHYRKQLLQLIDRRARAFGYATLFIGIVLALSAVILVANTIRLTIYAKRHIIRTMKLVGATPMFIRLPFLIEGMAHGLMGGIIASLLIDIVFTFFIQPLSQDLLMNIGVNFSFYLMLVLGGAVLGLLGSLISIGRFLKEALVQH
ncbi:MAG: permease-like cell division protein FtsX [Bacteroidota bacterium]|nr:permease-like cell division protein FtsX [Bacteroidota bacterium]